MKTFEIGAVDVDGTPQFLLSDEDTSILVTGFDASALDATPSKNDIRVEYTVLKKSNRITNFQFKKKLKRTAKKLIEEALVNALENAEVVT